MTVNESGGNVLTLKALTFKDGRSLEGGGGLEIRTCEFGRELKQRMKAGFIVGTTCLYR